MITPKIFLIVMIWNAEFRSESISTEIHEFSSLAVCQKVGAELMKMSSDEKHKLDRAKFSCVSEAGNSSEIQSNRGRNKDQIIFHESPYDDSLVGQIPRHLNCVLGKSGRKIVCREKQ